MINSAFNKLSDSASRFITSPKVLGLLAVTGIGLAAMKYYQAHPDTLLKHRKQLINLIPEGVRSVISGQYFNKKYEEVIAPVVGSVTASLQSGIDSAKNKVAGIITSTVRSLYKEILRAKKLELYFRTITNPTQDRLNQEFLIGRGNLRAHFDEVMEQLQTHMDEGTHNFPPKENSRKTPDSQDGRSIESISAEFEQHSDSSETRRVYLDGNELVIDGEIIDLSPLYSLPKKNSVLEQCKFKKACLEAHQQLKEALEETLETLFVHGVEPFNKGEEVANWGVENRSPLKEGDLYAAQYSDQSWEAAKQFVKKRVADYFAPNESIEVAQKNCQTYVEFIEKQLLAIAEIGSFAKVGDQLIEKYGSIEQAESNIQGQIVRAKESLRQLRKGVNIVENKISLHGKLFELTSLQSSKQSNRLEFEELEFQKKSLEHYSELQDILEERLTELDELTVANSQYQVAAKNDSGAWDQEIAKMGNVQMQSGSKQAVLKAATHLAQAKKTEFPNQEEYKRYVEAIEAQLIAIADLSEEKRKGDELIQTYDSIDGAKAFIEAELPKKRLNYLEGLQSQLEKIQRNIKDLEISSAAKQIPPSSGSFRGSVSSRTLDLTKQDSNGNSSTGGSFTKRMSTLFTKRVSTIFNGSPELTKQASETSDLKELKEIAQKYRHLILKSIQESNEEYKDLMGVTDQDIQRIIQDLRSQIQENPLKQLSYEELERKWSEVQQQSQQADEILDQLGSLAARYAALANNFPYAKREEENFIKPKDGQREARIEMAEIENQKKELVQQHKDLLSEVKTYQDLILIEVKRRVKGRFSDIQKDKLSSDPASYTLDLGKDGLLNKNQFKSNGQVKSNGQAVIKQFNRDLSGMDLKINGEKQLEVINGEKQLEVDAEQYDLNFLAHMNQCPAQLVQNYLLEQFLPPNFSGWMVSANKQRETVEGTYTNASQWVVEQTQDYWLNKVSSDGLATKAYPQKIRVKTIITPRGATLTLSFPQ